MDGAGTAQRHPASKLSPGQSEDIAQYPKQRGITVNIDDMVLSIDFDCVAHVRPRVFLPLQSTFMFTSFITFPGQLLAKIRNFLE
jgi:hypothetical protein